MTKILASLSRCSEEHAKIMQTATGASEIRIQIFQMFLVPGFRNKMEYSLNE